MSLHIPRCVLFNGLSTTTTTIPAKTTIEKTAKIKAVVVIAQYLSVDLTGAELSLLAKLSIPSFRYTGRGSIDWYAGSAGSYARFSSISMIVVIVYELKELALS